MSKEMNAGNIDGPRGTVFLVDDDAGVRKALGRLLRAHGFVVRSFDSAITFLRASPVARPACLVVDLRMPGMSGLTLQECLRDAESTLPVIFITGHGHVPDAAQALEGGAVAFIQKPFGEEQLLASVGRALALHLRREAARDREAEVRLASLTPRESELLAMLAEGRDARRIAGTLGISPHALDAHCRRLMKKLEVTSLAELAAWGGARGGLATSEELPSMARRVAGAPER